MMRILPLCIVGYLFAPSLGRADLGTSGVGLNTQTIQVTTRLHQKVTSTIEVTNYGVTNIDVENVEVYGRGFTSTTLAPGFEVLPNGKFVVQIVFEPHDTGDYRGSASIVVRPGLSEINRALTNARTSYNARIRSIADAIDELQKRGDGTADINAEEGRVIPRLTQRWREIEEDVARLRKLWLSLQDEQRHALEELRAGHYCSECKRPASQIERETNETFAVHIARVKGRALPATEEMIQQKKEEYDHKIAAALKALDARAIDSRNAWAEVHRERERFQKQRELAIATYTKHINDLFSSRALLIRELQDRIDEIHKQAMAARELVVALQGTCTR
jgi:hypothetical protein